jgi:zinc transport system substrate-binding protein
MMAGRADLARVAGACHRAGAVALAAARRVAQAALGAAVALTALAAGTPDARAVPPPVKVAATIFPLYDIVRHVGGDVAEVVLIMPPGVSPHTFEPTPSTVRELSGARTVFAIGHGLDDWAAGLARAAGVSAVVRVDQGIPLRYAGGGRPGSTQADPHYWLAIANARAIARTAAAEVGRLVPDRQAEVQAALAAYLERLEEADRAIRGILHDAPTRRIATFHGAFHYFAAAYALEVAAVFQPDAGREPSPRHVREFHRLMREKGVRTLFVEPQLPSQVIQAIARDLGVVLAVLDPLGGVPGRQTYIDLMLFNAGQIAASSRR